MAQDLFLHQDYLLALEKASPHNINWYAVAVFEENNIVGVAIVQRVALYLKDIFRQTNAGFLKRSVQEVVAKTLKGNILVVGNIMHTGQHALLFDERTLLSEVFYDQIFKALSDLKNQIRMRHHKKIRLIMFKDYFENDTLPKSLDFVGAHKFHKVSVQPNMILSLKTEWATLADYTKGLNKKYRDRFKRARKKLKNIDTIELDLDSLKKQSSELHQLYNHVSNNAKFNTFYLPDNHFVSLKTQLKNNFRVYGYYLENKLIGFYTLILNNDTLETYFLGYDPTYQKSKQLYLNMLFDMLKFGIDRQFKSIVYARTAMEIKSSIGAKPKPMVIYMKHTNSFLNNLLKPVFQVMNPRYKWKERHPFSKTHDSI